MEEHEELEKGKKRRGIKNGEEREGRMDVSKEREREREREEKSVLRNRK